MVDSNVIRHSVFDDIPLVREVQDGLDKRSSVTYDNSVRIMKLLRDDLGGHPQLVDFWNKYCLRMVLILLEQK
jgi:hypothetical protein